MSWITNHLFSCMRNWNICHTEQTFAHWFCASYFAGVSATLETLPQWLCVYIIEKCTKKRQKQVTSFSKVYLKRATTLSSPISDGTLQLISPCSDFSRMPLLVVRSTPVTWAAISTPRGCGRPESTSSSTPATPVPPLRWRFRYNT